MGPTILANRRLLVMSTRRDHKFGGVETGELRGQTSHLDTRHGARQDLLDSLSLSQERERDSTEV